MSVFRSFISRRFSMSKPSAVSSCAGYVSGLVKSFGQNTSGNVAVIMGLSLIPCFGMMGAALDYSRYLNLRDDMQQAVDQATLVAARQMEAGLDMTAAMDAASKAFKANLIRDDGVIEGELAPITQNASGALVGKATGTVNATLLLALGIKELEVTTFSTVVPRNSNFEIALVLDNSGSMRYDMGALREAATALVNSTFKNEDTSDRFSFSVVPFSAMVNVGAQHANATWMDLNAQSSIHTENFSYGGYQRNDKTYKNSQTLAIDDVVKFQKEFPTHNRFDLFNQLGVSWRGCVEQRSGALSVNDTPPNVTNPETLFVPTFAPDEPDYESSLSSAEIDARQHMNMDGTADTFYTSQDNSAYGQTDRSYSNDYLKDRPASCPQPVPGIAAEVIQTTKTCKEGTYRYEEDGVTILLNNAGTKPKCKNNKVNKIIHPSPVELVVTPAVPGIDEWLSTEKSQALTCKYQNAENVASLSSSRGPNFYCRTAPLLPLSSTRLPILQKINEMTAGGMTNIAAGFMWGWRTLSTAEPFTNGLPEDHATNSKVVILMTDGANTYTGRNNHNHSSYGSWGFGAKGRLNANTTSGSTYTLAMNGKLAAACANAKAANILVVTVAYRLSEGPTVDLLRECASSVEGEKQLKMAANASELVAQFKAIAEELSQLRIAE